MMNVTLSIFGIFAAVFLLTAGVILISDSLYLRQVKKEAQILIWSAEVQKGTVSRPDLGKLPAPVQRWLTAAGVVGKERITTVRLKQKGWIRTSQSGPWMEGEAEQYFSVDPPGFVWIPRFRMAPFIFFTGRDRYAKGQGKMTIKLLSLIPVVDAGGKEIDQSAMVRYLAEIIWLPTAALSSYITWEGIDNTTARAIMSYGGLMASAVFRFNEKGDVIEFTAQRYMSADTLETWSCPVTEYKEFDGFRIPVKGEAIWKLKTGDFSYYRLEITEIEYNKPFPY